MGGSLTPAASRGSASAAVPPDRTSRKRAAVTGGKATVRTGTAEAGSSATTVQAPPSSLASRTPYGGGAAPKPLGPGRPTVTAETVTGEANPSSIQAEDGRSGSRGRT